MSKEYSYNKKKLKSRQGRAVYGLLGQQLGGMGAVMAGGTKGNILGRYAVGSVAGMGAGYLAGGHLPMSDNGSLDYTVERAIKKYKKTGKKNAAFRDLEKNYDLKLSKRAALENFYLVKEGSRKNPNERTFKHRGKSYAYDHREYTHGTGVQLGGMLGAVGVGSGLLYKSPKAALASGLVSGGGGYILGKGLMQNLGEDGVRGLIDQKAKKDLKRIKLRRIN